MGNQVSNADDAVHTFPDAAVSVIAEIVGDAASSRAESIAVFSRWLSQGNRI